MEELKQKRKTEPELNYFIRNDTIFSRSKVVSLSELSIVFAWKVLCLKKFAVINYHNGTKDS